MEVKSVRWFVVGGVYTDGTFTTLEEGEAEVYGPFADENVAHRVHFEVSRRKIDLCWHKLYVVRTD